MSNRNVFRRWIDFWSIIKKNRIRSDSSFKQIYQSNVRISDCSRPFFKYSQTCVQRPPSGPGPQNCSPCRRLWGPCSKVMFAIKIQNRKRIDCSEVVVHSGLTVTSISDQNWCYFTNPQKKWMIFENTQELVASTICQN